MGAILKKEKWVSIINYFVFPIILLIYPLIHYNIGVDITDTGYSLGGFLFPNQMGEEWVTFSMYLANVIGRLLTKLPSGNTMMGMNLYTGLFVSATALIAYFFLQKKIPAWIVFIGEFIAISLCWCPTVILYNYLTYLLFTAAIVLLYQGLTGGKNIMLVLAGVMLGLNVMTRFPNITETALILSVWYYGWLNKKKAVKVVQETLLCVGGFLAGIGSIFLVLLIQNNLDSYFRMIGSLLTIGGSSEDGHSIADMLLYVIDAYVVAGKWFLYIVITVMAGMVLFAVWKEKLIRVKQVLYIAVILLLFRFLYGRGMFNFNYHEIFGAIFQWGAIFLIISLAVYILVIVNRKTSRQDKLLASMVLLLIVVTPLGSDNYLNQNINNLFLAAPLTLYWIWKFLQSGQGLTCGKRTINTYPVKAMLVMVIVIIVVQSTGFGFTFVFRDGKMGEKRDTKIEYNDVLKGMYTSKENAEALEGITEYCSARGLIGKNVLLYGDIPAMSCFLHMPAALSTSWADLPSYRINTMKSDIAAIEINIEKENMPVILLNAQIGAWISGDSPRMDYFGVSADKYAEEEKIKLIQELMAEEHYQETYANSKFVIYEVRESVNQTDRGKQ